MRKVYLVIILFSLFFFWKPNVTKAQLVCQCSNWKCDPTFCGTPPYLTGCGQNCKCTDPTYDPNCGTKQCGNGYYVCNSSPTNCCPIIFITPPAPPGGGGGGTGGGASCVETAPTNLTSVAVSPTSATLNWTPGAPGGASPYQALWVSTNSDPQAGCAGSLGGTATCPVRQDSSTLPLTSSQNTFTITNLLTANTTYYWEVMNLQASNCFQTAISSLMSSCSVSPASITLNQGSFQTISSSLTTGNGIQNVIFSTPDVTKISVSPASDNTFQYQTVVTGLNTTTTPANVKSDFYNTFGKLACTANTSVTVLSTKPWWQVENSDVGTNGDLYSSIPTIYHFEKATSPAGVPAYGGATNLNNSNVSFSGWLVASPIKNLKVYDYQYLNNQIPADTIIVPLTTNILDQATIDSNITPSYGYYWYKYDGSVSGLDLNLNSNLNIGSKKVIILVNSANFNVNGNINLIKGKGFFMVMVGKDINKTKGNIRINPSIGGGAGPNLEGIYEADGTFDTGTTGTKSDSTLIVRGSVVAYDGFALKRDLGSATNATTKAELFQFAPDQIMLYPATKLGIRKLNWKEVAP